MKKLLIIADPEGTHQLAIQRGLQLAEQINAQVHILAYTHAFLNRFPIKISAEKAVEIQQAMLDKRNNEMDIAIATSNSKVPLSDIEVSVIWDKNLAKHALEVCEKEQAHLIIKSGHRSETFFYTPADWTLIRNCPCPILLLSKSKWRSKHNVLAAIDFNTKSKTKQELNESVLSYAKQFNDLMGADMIAASVIPVSPVLNDLGFVFADEQEAVAQEQVLPEFKKYIQEHAPQTKQCFMRAGEPHLILTSLAAKNKVDLVILGCVGHKAISGKLIGNTAEKILQHIKSDVLVIKP